VTPLGLVPLGGATQANAAFGRVSPNHPCHAAYTRRVDKVTADGVAVFAR
jgi:hypothetical protein